MKIWNQIKLITSIIISTNFNSIADDSEWLNNYQGVLKTGHGLRKMGMTLIFDDVVIRGSYYFHDNPIDIPIYGWLLPNNQIELRVQNPNKEITMIMVGRFVRPGKCCDTGADKSEILGAWHWGSAPPSWGSSPSVFFSLENATARAKGEGRYSVAGAMNDHTIETAAQNFCKWVSEDSRTDLSEMIDYPIHVIVEGQKIEISTKEDFLHLYDRIFTKAFKQTISKCIPHNMFCNYKGVMLGRGEIWFGDEGEVMAINNASIFP